MTRVYDAIFWDFDGVIIDSLPIKELGYRKIFEQYPKEAVDELIAYHDANGGISRFVKIDYFFEYILGESVSEAKKAELANLYSEVMLKHLQDKAYLRDEVIDVLTRFRDGLPMHIVSGTEDKELKLLCGALGVAKFFKSIHGSPDTKEEIINRILNTDGYNPTQVLMVGDATTDLNAAETTGLDFLGCYNNKLKSLCSCYREDLSNLDLTKL